MPELLVPAPAKLNLFLHVVGRRADGYHELESLMVLLDFGDRISLRTRQDSQIRLLTPLPNVASEDDLCVRAARLLQRETGCDAGVDMEVDKRIPLGSGMGGGSSDAASILLTLNRLWNLGLRRRALMALGAQLGADVPFFLFGGSAVARGVGEMLSAVSLPCISVAIAVPPVPVSTQLVFQAPELKRDTPRITHAAFPLDFGRNDLQPAAVAYFPEIGHCADLLSEDITPAPGDKAIPKARMTGSGGAVFRILPNTDFGESCCARLKGALPAGSRCVVARTLSRHPLCGFAEE